MTYLGPMNHRPGLSPTAGRRGEAIVCDANGLAVLGNARLLNARSKSPLPAVLLLFLQFSPCPNWRTDGSRPRLRYWGKSGREARVAQTALMVMKRLCEVRRKIP